MKYNPLIEWIAVLYWVIILIVVYQQASAYEPSTQLDAVVACVVLEAANQPRAGQIAVANVIFNRAAAKNRTPRQIVLANSQFCSMRGGELASIMKAKYDARFKRAWPLCYDIVNAVASGSTADNTRGATYFATTRIAPTLKWYRSGGITIGDHYFWK